MKEKIKQPWQKALEWLKRKWKLTDIELLCFDVPENKEDLIKALKLCQEETIKQIFEDIENIKTTKTLAGVPVSELIEWNIEFQNLKKRWLK